MVVFTAGEWSSHQGQMWQNTARALTQRGIEIYAYGIQPEARKEQLQSVTTKPENAFLIRDYVLLEPIPSGVSGEMNICLIIPSVSFSSRFNQ